MGILRLVILTLYVTVCSARILKRVDVNVSLGADAVFSCELPGAAGVKQVVWQQHRGDGTLQIVATFTERSKPQLDHAFLGKVNVTVASVHTTSIVIRNVTFADEACYVCTFSVYPSGTQRETACLTVQGLSELTSKLRGQSKEQDTSVSCSATGKPTPVISWWSGETILSNYLSETFTVQNEDSSFTTTSNLTILQSQFSGKYLKCVAKSGSVERSIRIEEKQTDIETPVASRYYVLSAVLLISYIIIASSFVILFHCKNEK